MVQVPRPQQCLLLAIQKSLTCKWWMLQSQESRLAKGVYPNLNKLFLSSRKNGLVLRLHPLTRWLLSASLVVPSQQSWFLNEWMIISSWGSAVSLASINSCITLHYFIGLFRIDTADSAQPRKCSMATRSFSLWEGGVLAWDYNSLVPRLLSAHTWEPGNEARDYRESTERL